MDETKSFASFFSKNLTHNDIVVLSGDLGAGKTQFVQGIAKGFNIDNQIISPTFNILLQYEGCRLYDGSLATLNHFDLYRLEDPTDLEDIGFYDILESGGVSVIEWGEKFIDEIPDNYWQINISKTDETSRKIVVERIENE